VTIPVLLGLDLGSSSLKALLMAPDGRVMAEASAPYATLAPAPGFAEQDPRAWWLAAGRATRAALAAAGDVGVTPEVAAVGLSGQMHTLVLVDGRGEPVRPAISWMDTRAAVLLPDIAAIVERAGPRGELANPVVVGLTLPPLHWLQRHEPASLAAAQALLSAKDWLRQRLTGLLGSEPTDASATLLFDVPRRRWSGAVVDAFGLDARLFPPLGEPQALAGWLTADAAAHLGLRPGVPVAYGAGDAQAAALALGSVHDGDTQLMVGTGAQPSVVREALPTVDPGRGLHVFCHVRGWLQQASVNNAGASLGWVRDLLGLSWDELYGAFDGSPPAAPTFLPYLTGERAQLMKGHARGAWLGLEPSHDRAALARAAVAGVIAGVAAGMDAVYPSLGAVVAPVRAAGGGLRHPTFAQGVADASERTLEVRDARAASAVGAALLGGVAAGVYPDLDAAVATAPRAISARYVPRPRMSAAWRALADRLNALDGAGLHEIVAG